MFFVCLLEEEQAAQKTTTKYGTVLNYQTNNWQDLDMIHFIIWSEVGMAIYLLLNFIS